MKEYISSEAKDLMDFPLILYIFLELVLNHFNGSNQRLREVLHLLDMATE